MMVLRIPQGHLVKLMGALQKSTDRDQIGSDPISKGDG